MIRVHKHKTSASMEQCLHRIQNLLVGQVKLISWYFEYVPDLYVIEASTKQNSDIIL